MTMLFPRLIQLNASGELIRKPAERQRNLVVIFEPRRWLIVYPWHRLIHAALHGRSLSADSGMLPSLPLP